MSTSVNYYCEANTAYITIDNPPVNATSQHVRSGLMRSLVLATEDQCTHGIISCNGRTFVAGGDISEFGKPPSEPHLPDVYNAFEASEIIWIAAMHGTVLGGGFELALACDYRIALEGTKFGLPEVNLGLVPGAGGTQRLPRLVGLDLAIEIACKGKLIDADRLQTAGGLDKVVENDLVEQAKLFLQDNKLKRKPLNLITIEAISSERLAQSTHDLEKFSKGANAPLLNLEALRWATDLPFNEGQMRERKLHLELRDSDQSIALRHVFFGERAVAKPAIIKDAKITEIKKVTIVGGGLMGAGIAASCLSAGLQVSLIERDMATAKSGFERVEAILIGGLKRGKVTQGNYNLQIANIQFGDNYELAQNSDLAIEAVFEDLEVKQAIFSELSGVMRKDAIIATNTSYLDPELIGKDVANPGRLMGLHFFSPAHLMKLVEIIRNPTTSADTIATAFSFTKRLGKIGVLCGVCDGFVGNRMLSAYRRQADYFLADGATPLEIDAAMRQFGMPMGPYELQDMTGLQIAWANRKRQAASRNPNERYVSIADKLCESDRIGQRAGKGWYRYEKNSRSPIEDINVADLICQYSQENHLTRNKIDADHITSCLLAVLANEGARIVEEGIVERDLDVDIVKIHGYGFPRWRGGPMHCAKIIGETKIAKSLAAIQSQSPKSWVLAKRYS